MKDTKEREERYDSAYTLRPQRLDSAVHCLSPIVDICKLVNIHFFSSPRIFCQLVKGFVKEDFVRELEPGHFKRLENRSFISPEFLKRETDLIYHVVMEEREVYFYILLEFQSTPDKRMPIRLFSYLLLFYEQMIKHSQRGKLPAVFPMVLYNGIKPWNIPVNIRDAIDGGVIPEQYLLRGNYYLLDENRVSEERLMELHNLAAAVIYYEKHKRSDDMKLAMNSMLEMLKGEEFDEIRQIMLWALRISGRKFDESEISRLKSFQEGPSALPKKITKAPVEPW